LPLWLLAGIPEILTNLVVQIYWLVSYDRPGAAPLSNCP